MNRRKDETDEQFTHRVHDQGKVFGKDYLTEQDHKNIDDELRRMGIDPEEIRRRVRIKRLLREEDLS